MYENTYDIQSAAWIIERALFNPVHFILDKSQR